MNGAPFPTIPNVKKSTIVIVSQVIRIKKRQIKKSQIDAKTLRIIILSKYVSL